MLQHVVAHTVTLWGRGGQLNGLQEPHFRSQLNARANHLCTRASSDPLITGNIRGVETTVRIRQIEATEKSIFYYSRVT
jgi:hypothetical protein